MSRALFERWPNLLFPEVPDPIDHCEINRIGVLSLLGAEVSHLRAETDCLRLKTCIDVRVVGAEDGDLDRGTDGDIAMTPHQHNSFVRKRPRQRLTDPVVAHNHVRWAKLPGDVPHRHSSRKESGIVVERPQGRLAYAER